MKPKKMWDVPASNISKNTSNPIRAIVDTIELNPNPDKQMIALSIGDPTVFGNLKPAEVVIEAVVESVKSMKFNGYVPSTGTPKAREAIAAYTSTETSHVTAKDVIICSGCSSSLEMCITVLANPGDNILVPRPGFPLYQTLAHCIGIHTKFYNLLPERGWEADLKMLEAQIDASTRAIVINNPSNPCGSVFDEAHLRQILDIAARRKVPIIADEIYDHFVFPGNKFHYIASLTKEVPILSCSGLTKRYLVPGWRMGWITVHDHDHVLKEVRAGLQRLSTRTIGSNTLVQGALQAILSRTPGEFFRSTLEVVQTNAEIAYGALSAVKGLKPVMPRGAMYMMVGIEMERFPEFSSDLQVVEAMVTEQSVFCLPGKCFDLANYVRLVLTVPPEFMREACERMAEFCATHYVEPDGHQSELSDADEVTSSEPVKCDCGASDVIRLEIASATPDT
ncbi:LOW QUALITY PROTEIN: tyrosine aminotransferase-like [Pollicipes pollicipes]|uniref:LOW QUALITY PROTEIN: tyrosine aminotransferase-like n=1 Tax=Pollicipes pollicipes TaxID=41117 RepID=UPI00188538CD|nr:LOW QUALITY PROTEIN: tyrosine aminotransferase-like [Pollicipes pollicipes]